MRFVWAIGTLALLTAACGSPSPEPSPLASGTAGFRLGIDTAAMDLSVRPQDDLYRFVNGTWLERTPIPPDHTNYGAFIELADRAEEDLRLILEEAAGQEVRPAGSDLQKIGDFYLSFMDTVRVEEAGLSPLRPTLDRIDGIRSRTDLIDVLAAHEILGVQNPLSLGVSQDRRDANSYITYLGQSGLGLPDRDYYFNEDERFRMFREKYADYVARLLILAATPDAAAAARRIVDIETRLAGAHWTRVENRDREKTYNKVTVDELAELAPGLEWRRYLEGSGVGGIGELVVRQPSYFEALSATLADITLDDWKLYLRYKALDAFAPYLSREFVEARFDFRGRTLRGAEENRDRWKRAVSSGNRVLGEILGRAFVARHFREESKARMDEMVENLRDAFRGAIDELEWVGEETRAEAQAKLTRFNVKIGHPDEWKDYAKLEIRADDLLGNIMRSRRVEHERSVSRLGEPVDRGEWFMTPQTVNAYHSATMNEIVFPAAILRPPFFDPTADDAVNYGGIGAVIGHEFSHGFDDQGRKSDGYGNLRDWWTEEDAERFRARAGRLVEQYAGYSPIEGMKVNGELTLGENIGDLAGLTMAYRAYRLSLGGAEPPVIDGYTGDQRFFMGWAQVWRRKYREDELRRRLVIDSHSPSEYRANGSAVNVPAFHDAFDTAPGDRMWKAPADRVKIW